MKIFEIVEQSPLLIHWIIPHFPLFFCGGGVLLKSSMTWSIMKKSFVDGVSIVGKPLQPVSQFVCSKVGFILFFLLVKSCWQQCLSVFNWNPIIADINMQQILDVSWNLFMSVLEFYCKFTISYQHAVFWKTYQSFLGNIFRIVSEINLINS